MVQLDAAVRSLQERRVIFDGIGDVTGLSVTNDGLRIITANDDGIAHIWDLKTGVEIRALVGHSGMLKAVATSGDGHLIATGGEDGVARLWDSATGEFSLLSFAGIPGR